MRDQCSLHFMKYICSFILTQSKINKLQLKCFCVISGTSQTISLSTTLGKFWPPIHDTVSVYYDVLGLSLDRIPSAQPKAHLITM